MLKRQRILVAAVLRLGLLNVVTVALYRFAIRFGVAKYLLPQGESYRAPLFHNQSDDREKVFESSFDTSIVAIAEELLEGKVTYFSHRKFNVGSPPDWFRNPVNNQGYADPWRHWSLIGDFDSKIGDIKTIWELSRFDWALVLARAYRQSGDLRFLKVLNAWSSDWIENNPLNTGPNWKCGQEAGIRMQQVLLTAYLLQQHENPTKALVRFVAEHCSRIEPTIRYAIAQNNNHGTSEASALFVGGAWLEKFSEDSGLRQKGLRWKNKGRRWLENRVQKLVAEDGSFSQYSVNYHRLLVETLNIAEVWRRELALKEFSESYYARCRAAVLWLYRMVDTISGDAPNLGSNDGARLFVLSSGDYRDYRPTVQLGAVLFLKGMLYSDGPWNEPLFWLGMENCNIPCLNLSKGAAQFDQGGYVVFSGGEDSWAVLRYPRFRFRPSHADAFHFDLWCRGINVLRDSGSFSYNTEPPWQSYFSSTKAHNTVEFDARDQMPSLRRFLRGAWLKMDSIGGLSFSNGETSWAGSYRDYLGSKHKRTIIQNGQSWKIIDEIDGVQSLAVLRWRLAPGDWKVSDLKCIGPFGSVQISSSVPVKRFELVEGWESRYYFLKTKLPVLEIEVGSKKAVITSEVCLDSGFL